MCVCVCLSATETEKVDSRSLEEVWQGGTESSGGHDEAAYSNEPRPVHLRPKVTHKGDDQQVA